MKRIPSGFLKKKNLENGVFLPCDCHSQFYDRLLIFTVLHEFYLYCSEEKTQKKEGDYERAERAIFRGMEQVEHTVQKAIEDEVHLMFDDIEHHRKKEISEHVKKAVSKGASKAKERAEVERQKKNNKGSIPFLPKHVEEKVEHHDHRILHAIEEAEKAVLHAVQQEVDSLFHGADEHPLRDEPKTTKKAKASVKKGVEKASKHVEDNHEERKRWIESRDNKAIDEYIKSTNSMYGMGF